MKQFIIGLLAAVVSFNASADFLPELLISHQYEMEVQIGDQKFIDHLYFNSNDSGLTGSVVLPGVFDEEMLSIEIDEFSHLRFRHIKFDIVIDEGRGPLHVQYQLRFDYYENEFSGIALYKPHNTNNELKFLGFLSGKAK